MVRRQHVDQHNLDLGLGGEIKKWVGRGSSMQPSVSQGKGVGRGRGRFAFAEWHSCAGDILVSVV